MPASPYDWDEGNLEHILERHGLEPGDVLDALHDPDRTPAQAYNTPTEKRRAVIAMTERGRLLFIVYTERGGRIRPFSVREATDRERRMYQRRRGRR